MPSESKLLNLQRRFMGALGEPIYGDSRDRSELPPREGQVSQEFRETADELISPSGNLQPVERLELYHRQYWYRLLDSIDEDFPALKFLLGDEAFWGLMEAYLAARPPRSYTLRHLGADLPDFICHQPHLVDHPVHAQDLARLEYALCLAFEAGQEEALPAADLTSSQVFLQPHMALLAMRTEAFELWSQAEEDGPQLELVPAGDYPKEFLAVYREGLAVRVKPIPQAAFEILSALHQTHSLSLAMDRVAARSDLLSQVDMEQVGHWFADWFGRGWLCGPPQKKQSNGERI